MPLAVPAAMPYWIAALLLLALLAVVLLVLANPIAIWVLPLVAVILVGIGVVRAREARCGSREAERS